MSEAKDLHTAESDYRKNIFHAVQLLPLEQTWFVERIGGKSLMIITPESFNFCDEFSWCYLTLYLKKEYNFK